MRTVSLLQMDPKVGDLGGNGVPMSAGTVAEMSSAIPMARSTKSDSSSRSRGG